MADQNRLMTPMELSKIPGVPWNHREIGYLVSLKLVEAEKGARFTLVKFESFKIFLQLTKGIEIKEDFRS